MNQNYIKQLFYGTLIGAIMLPTVTVKAQQTISRKQRDRADLIASVDRIQLDHRKIVAARQRLEESRKTGNRKSVRLHRDKLANEKKILKADYSNAKEEQCTYIENKSSRIKRLSRN
jgi:hypothetical protein